MISFLPRPSKPKRTPEAGLGLLAPLLAALPRRGAARGVPLRALRGAAAGDLRLLDAATRSPKWPIRIRVPDLFLVCLF